MALTIEDGSLVAGADSYVSVADARTYAVKMGATFPPDDDDGNAAAEILLREAMSFLESLRSSYQGTKVSRDQDLQFPRVGVEIDGFEVDSDSIPKELIQAQIELAIIAQDQDLQPNSDGREIVRAKVEGAVEVQWSETGGPPTPVFARAQALLDVLLDGGGGFTLSSDRV